ncbi:hypothetical protein C2S51_002154 [Perilla frutescens var. frutescens]|nr:hypothetical protein C2S51_002154 [Perilla frutescens var. frutescens]
MDEEALQWPSHENACWPRSYSSRKYDRFVSCNVPVKRRNSPPIWRQIWNKLKKLEKKRIFHCSNPMSFTYDPHSYSQNFDQGSSWTDHDDLSRSFSARFAVPSTIFHNPPRFMV